ncbi:MAG: glutathione S-transferase family protein [Caldimonas sp.]
MTPAADSTLDSDSLVLVSHALCPYVQRAAIVLAEKGIAFERREVDLAAKPAWFLAASPLGKTPVLLAEGTSIFESAVICEYLEDRFAPRLHPVDVLERARHRSWIEFASQLLNTIGAFYAAPEPVQLEAQRSRLATRFAQVEAVLDAGPYFAGCDFSIVDAAFAPVLRYFEVFDQIADFGIFDGRPRLRDWRAALAKRPSVQLAVGPRYAELLERFLRARGSVLSRQLDTAKA